MTAPYLSAASGWLADAGGTNARFARQAGRDTLCTDALQPLPVTGRAA